MRLGKANYKKKIILSFREGSKGNKVVENGQIPFSNYIYSAKILMKIADYVGQYSNKLYNIFDRYVELKRG